MALRLSGARSACASRSVALRRHVGLSRPHPVNKPLSLRLRSRVLCQAGEREDAVGGLEFYNRDEEKKYLTTLWSNKPTSVLIVLGPPSSGKSALLKELVFSRKKVPLPLYTDCRANNYLNSDAFAKNLLKGINRSWHDRIEGLAALLQWTITTSSPAGSLRLELPPGATSSTSLELIFEVFDKVVSDTKMSRQPGDPWPLIIIDDANRLMNWRTSESESLEQLLAYFVRLSKQEKLAHVVLATSDSFFLRWLTKHGIGDEFRSEMVIGNFNEAQAKDYLLKFVLPDFKPALQCTDADWAMIYEVCGGNPGRLNDCTSQAVSSQSWTKACDAIRSSSRDKVLKGFSPLSWDDAKWTRGNYCATVAAIAASEHGAVKCSVLETTRATGGESAIASMLKSNLLVYRSYDTRAHDVPETAFGAPGKPKEAVYMLPSSAHLVVVRDMLASGELKVTRGRASLRLNGGR